MSTQLGVRVSQLNSHKTFEFLSYLLSSYNVSPLTRIISFIYSDIFDAMFLVKHNVGEIVIQQGTYLNLTNI